MAIFDNFDWGSALSNAFGLGAPEGSPVGGGPPLNVQPPPPPPSNDVVSQDFSQLPPQQQLPSPGLPAPGTPLPPPRPPQAPTLASAVAPGVPPGDMAFQGPPQGAAAAPLPPPVTINRPPGPQAGIPPKTQLFPPGPPGGPTAQMPPGAVPPGGAPPGQPYPNVGPFLSNLFGPNPRLAQQIGGSLGEGLKSVGQNWNKPGLAAFAGSAGAAISGGTKADKEYFGELAKAVQINDAKNTADSRTELMRQKLLTAQKTGTIRGVTAAWQASEQGRAQLAEAETLKRVEGERKQYEYELKSPIDDERKAAREHIAQFEKEERARQYARSGLDPEKAEHYKNQGKTVYGKDGKPDMEATGKQAKRPRTWDEFQGTVKKDDWYWTKKDGKDVLLQRAADPPPPSDHPASPLAQIPDFSPEGTADERAPAEATA